MKKGMLNIILSTPKDFLISSCLYLVNTEYSIQALKCRAFFIKA